MSKKLYIPIKTINFSDASISKAYIYTWSKNLFIHTFDRKEPDSLKQFNFSTCLS